MRASGEGGWIAWEDREQENREIENGEEEREELATKENGRSKVCVETPFLTSVCGTIHLSNRIVNREVTRDQ